MRQLRRPVAIVPALLALVAGACGDGSGTTPGHALRIGLAPRFQAGAESALPTTRVRIAVRRVLVAEDGEGFDIAPVPIATLEQDVNPDDPAWELGLDVPLAVGDETRVQATLELLNVASGKGATVEWSGRTGHVVVLPGEETRVEPVVLGRGGLANLDVASVTASPLASIVVGDSADASASLAPGVDGATVLWGTLDPGVVSVSPEGRVRGLVIGRAIVTATSGLAADSIFVSIVSAASTVTGLTIDAGNNQSAIVNNPVATPPRVATRNAAGAPVPNVPVTFTVGSGGGSFGGGVTSVQVTTGAAGTAQVPAWVLGRTAGTNTVVATAGQAQPATFVATGTPAPPASITVVSGNNQQGTAGTALPQPLVVVVRDLFGNAVPGAAVSFSSPQSGPFAPATATTNAQGLAQSTWTPSFSTATQTATAGVGGVATLATFTAFVFIPPR